MGVGNNYFNEDCFYNFNVHVHIFQRHLLMSRLDFYHFCHSLGVEIFMSTESFFFPPLHIFFIVCIIISQPTYNCGDNTENDFVSVKWKSTCKDE